MKAPQLSLKVGGNSKLLIRNLMCRHFFAFMIWGVLILSGSLPLLGQEVWTDNDIGTIGTAGSSSYNSSTDTFTLNGAGMGIGGVNDSCHLVSWQVSGNVEIIGHIGSLQNTSNYATAGLMMRESTVPEPFLLTSPSVLAMEFRLLPALRLVQRAVLFLEIL